MVWYKKKHHLLGPKKTEKEQMKIGLWFSNSHGKKQAEKAAELQKRRKKDLECGAKSPEDRVDSYGELFSNFDT